MSLNMKGHVSGKLKTGTGTRTARNGSYVNGRYVEGAQSKTKHTITIQAAPSKDIMSLENGGERIIDPRVIYINDGELTSVSPADLWTFNMLTGTYKTLKMDSRPWANYCKLIVSRIDD